jgi:hypothetical protein
MGEQNSTGVEYILLNATTTEKALFSASRNKNLPYDE